VTRLMKVRPRSTSRWKWPYSSSSRERRFQYIQSTPSTWYDREWSRWKCVYGDGRSCYFTWNVTCSYCEEWGGGGKENWFERDYWITWFRCMSLLLFRLLAFSVKFASLSTMIWWYRLSSFYHRKELKEGVMLRINELTFRKRLDGI